MVALLIIGCYELGNKSRLSNWCDQVQMGNISATYIVNEGDNEGGKRESKKDNYQKVHF